MNCLLLHRFTSTHDCICIFCLSTFEPKPWDLKSRWHSQANIRTSLMRNTRMQRCMHQCNTLHGKPNPCTSSDTMHRSPNNTPTTFSTSALLQAGTIFPVHTQLLQTTSVLSQWIDPELLTHTASQHSEQSEVSHVRTNTDHKSTQIEM